jgi:hypothetical protein
MWCSRRPYAAAFHATSEEFDVRTRNGQEVVQRGAVMIIGSHQNGAKGRRFVAALCGRQVGNTDTFALELVARLPNSTQRRS